MDSSDASASKKGPMQTFLREAICLDHLFEYVFGSPFEDVFLSVVSKPLICLGNQILLMGGRVNNRSKYVIGLGFFRCVNTWCARIAHMPTVGGGRVTFCSLC